MLENIPAESAYGLTITQPSIYYGESMPGYRIVATGIKEFDYPKGNRQCLHQLQREPAESRWTASGKGSCSPGPERRQHTIHLLSPAGKPDSDLEDVQERVQQIAPFLRLDQDPYAVVSEGKLYWIRTPIPSPITFPIPVPTRRPLTRAELHSKLGEGHRGHVQRNRPVLRHGSEATPSWRFTGGRFPACSRT